MNIRILLLSCAFLGTFVQTSFAAAAAPAVSAILGTIKEYNPERDRDFVHSLCKEYWHLQVKIILLSPVSNSVYNAKKETLV